MNAIPTFEMDPIQTEIMKNRFAAIVEEAATVAMRTAHTTFVKQTQDFQVAAAGLDGYKFGFPMQLGTMSGGCQTMIGLVKSFDFDEFEPGDVVVSNCPFSTGGLVTHQMDIHMAQPIFVDGKLTAFAWSFIHASDIGGAVAGSISPDLYECFQEGFRIRPSKLVRAGVLNEDLANVIKDNSRISEDIWGDLEALMAAMRLLDRRINEICAKVGIEAFQRGVRDVMAYAEMKARHVISSMKDGTYTFTDYLEGDNANEAVHVHCRLTVRGDEAEIDYTGSSPQVHGAFNFSTGGRTHPFLTFALIYLIQTMEPDAPLNGGIIRPIRAFAPSGTIMNAEFPAAMGNRYVAVVRCFDALMGCINQALPGGIVASGAGQAGIISSSWIDPGSGRNRVAVVEPFSGGSGGRIKFDGVEANDTMNGHLKSAPIEHVEVETPLIIRKYSLLADRFGHGKHRGGSSVSIEIECRGAEVKIAARGLDRFQFQPWGIFGGLPGYNSEVTLRRQGGVEENIGRIRVLTLKHKDRVRMVSSSGGGFGDPLERDPQLVLRDVLDDLLSDGTAREIYGVVIRDGAVDEQETAALRGRIAGKDKPEGPAIRHGAARGAYEKKWPVACSTRLANEVLSLSPGLRRLSLMEIRRICNTGDAPLTEEALAAAIATVGKMYSPPQN